MAVIDPANERLGKIDPRIDGIDRRLDGIDTRLISLEIGQKWLVWGVGITLAMVMGNFAVTIAMALHLLTQKL